MSENKSTMQPKCFYLSLTKIKNRAKKKVVINAASYLQKSVDIWYLAVWSPGKSNEMNKKAWL